MKQEELSKILLDHEKWLKGEGGKRADLRESVLQGVNLQGVNLQGVNLLGVNLRGSNLRGSDLKWADLRWADLRGSDLREADLQESDLKWADLREVDLKGADLRETNLQGANLQRADLQGANLQGANLQRADLQGANLRWANLQRADLQGANLRWANLQDCFALQLQCPESGGFTAYKKLADGLICELYVLPESKRSSATTRKCRCDKAKVVSITDKNGTPYTEGVSKYDCNFIYKVGEIVEVQTFDGNRWAECSTGIHFFITKQEAIDY